MNEKELFFAVGSIIVVYSVLQAIRMLSALLGPLRFEDEEKDAEMGDDEVMEGENEGEKKEGQEGEEAATEKKEESENAEKAPEEGNPENKEENKKPTESVSSEAPKAEKYVYYTIY